MKTLKRIVLFLVAATVISPAMADDAARFRGGEAANVALAVDRTSTVHASRPTVGTFAALSPVNKAIAEGIFVNQSVTAEGQAPFNLDQIAYAKRAGGWVMVFSRLKESGLTRAENVDELINGAPRNPLAKLARPAAAKGRLTVVTTGSGRRLYFYRKPARRAARAGAGQGS